MIAFILKKQNDIDTMTLIQNMLVLMAKNFIEENNTFDAIFDVTAVLLDNLPQEKQRELVPWLKVSIILIRKTFRIRFLPTKIAKD